MERHSGDRRKRQRHLEVVANSNTRAQLVSLATLDITPKGLQSGRKKLTLREFETVARTPAGR